MSEEASNYYSILLITIGAISGAWVRWKITENIQNTYLKSWSTFSVNIISTFFLGLLLSLLGRIESADVKINLSLLIGLGFLGSLSTFSTFIMDLLETMFNQKWKQSILLLLSSIFGGLLMASLGYKLGNQ